MAEPRIRIPETKSIRGFTLLEVIAVLILIGLLAIAAAGRLSGSRGELHKAADTLKSHLRFAQKMAMNSDLSWGIFSTGGSYWLFSGNSTANRSTLPAEEKDAIDLPDSISTDSFSISFDSEWGMPHDSVQPGNGTRLTADRTITVNSPSSSIDITITRNTGFIP